MDAKLMKEAKPHLDALKAICEKAGMSMDELVKAEMPEMEESMDEYEDDAEEKGPDKGKIALMIAKLKPGQS